MGGALLENLCFRLGDFRLRADRGPFGDAAVCGQQHLYESHRHAAGRWEGFAVAAAALVGRELGAGHKGRAEMVAKLCFGMAVVFDWA